MKKNVKAFIVIVILGLASVLAGCNSAINGTGKNPEKKTTPAKETPAKDNPSSDDSDLTKDPADLPLTFEVITAGKIILTGTDAFEKIGIQKNDSVIFEPAANISVQPGDIIRFYASGYKYAQTGEINLTINCTATCYVYGNLMSLVEYTTFAEKTEIKQNYALQKLFINNTHIKNHETLDIILPATVLSDYCYKQMFSGCTGLTRAPELPAQTLAKGCYKALFLGCTGLTKAPDLLAPVLAEECYDSMFYNCTKLNYIKCLATNIKAADSTKNWIVNVSSTGSFIGSQGNNIWVYKDKTSGIPLGWESDPVYAAVDAKQLPLTLEAEEDNTIITIKNLNNFINLQYSRNGGEKETASDTINVSAGEKICFYAKGPKSSIPKEDQDYMTINCTKDCYVYGNIMSLLYVDNFSDKTKIEKNFAFQKLFYDNNHIKNISIDLVLPATTLTQGCYQKMFYQCIRLTSAPVLPATKMEHSCYKYMFCGCKGLTTMPELPATTMADYCYMNMFTSCSGLTTLSPLPATTMADFCYLCMFQKCTSLTTVPEDFLPADTVSKSCYKYMFANCTSLTNVPELPATTVKEASYMFMYMDCKSLATPPELPATNLGESCYYSMFEGCTSLLTAPELPATTLAKTCYKSMFSGCTNLTTAPELPAETMQDSCYYSMFKDCTNLSVAPVLKATTLASFCYHGMFSGCTKITTITCLAESSTGDLLMMATPEATYEFVGPNENGLLISPNPDFWSSSAYFPDTWTVEKEYPLSLEVIREGTISFTNPTEFTNLKYSKNFGEKIDVIDSIPVVEGDTISFYADGPKYGNNLYLTINCSSDCAIYGNIMSLVKRDRYADIKELERGDDDNPKTGAFKELFKGNTHLKNHTSKKLTLPATTLNNSCYSAMFEGCTGLTEAPELPATSLTSNCYTAMFRGCTSLTVAPELPANELSEDCYYSMFNGCTSLINPPSMDAVTTTSNYCCQSMFAGCTSLKTAPVLNAKTLNFKCYESMFAGCTSLTAAPELPATTLGNYCYANMFSGCTNIKYIKCLATNISALNCTYCWVLGVSPTGTFVKNPDMENWTTGDLGIPSGWTVENAQVP